MPIESHVRLLIEVRAGQPVREPVHVVDLGGGRLRLLYSPGFVQGIAAGDEFRLKDEDGRFDVLSRAGNVAVQVYSASPIGEERTELVERVVRIGGRLDGAVSRGMVFTIPIAAGFSAIERIVGDWIAARPGCEWYYGNVYDPADGKTPLNWWARR